MAVAAAVHAPIATAPAAMRCLLVELNCLKRIRSAGRSGSIAARLFARAWSNVAAGADLETVALAATADALVAARMGDIDDATLATAGLPTDERRRIRRGAIEAVARQLDPDCRRRLIAADLLGDGPPPPAFVSRLAAQPRAGATCPGRPRIMLEPAESHAEHCAMVAIYGVLLAPSYGANTGDAFLIGLAHHLHNARLPDAGFAGEVLLGDSLPSVVQTFAAEAIGELPPHARAPVEQALASTLDAESPEARAFHAADVIDRVVEIDGRLAAARVTMADVLGDMALVHDGPLKAFHDRTLAQMGLP